MSGYPTTTAGRSSILASLFALVLVAASAFTAGTAASLDPAEWSFRVETPHQVWSDGGSWAVGTQIRVLVNDGTSGPEYSGIATVEQWGPNPTDVGWWLDTSPFEIEPGDAVNVTDDGPDTKDLDVVDLTIDPIDPTIDTLSGTAPEGTTVEVHASDGTDDSNRTLVVGASETWTADFTTGDLFDIRPGTWGSAAIFDDDLDATQRNWQVNTPTFEVDPQGELITGNWWQIGTTVTVAVDDLGTGVGADWSDSSAVVVAPWDATQGYVEFFPGASAFDLQAGQVVTMSDGVTDKIHTISPLVIDDIDEDADTVGGTATAGSPVTVWVSAPVDMQRTVTAAGDGRWTADFSVPADGYAAYDISAGDQIDAREYDTDGDTTFVVSNVPNPAFSVETPNQVWAGGEGWIVGRTVTVTVDDDGIPGNGTLHTSTALVEAWGTEPWEVGWNVDTGSFEILPGHDVTVDDGVDTTRSLDVVALVVSDVDEGSDTITGLAPGLAWIDAHGGDGTVGANRRVQADAAGLFTVDFGNPGTEGWEQDILDIRPGVDGAVQVNDADGDSTHRGWRVASPHIGVNVIHEELWAIDFPIGATLDFTVSDSEYGIYEGSMTVHETSHGQTEAGYRFWEEFDLRAGQLITVGDGTTTRVLIVSTLEVTNVDAETDRYVGTVDPGNAHDSVTEVCAWARDLSGAPDSGVNLCDVPDAGTGAWEIDFTGVGDIVAGDHSTAWQLDPDGDETHFAWFVPPWIYVVIGDDTNPDFPDQIQLEQWHFPVTVTNGTDTVVVADPDGDGHETIEFDVTPGETITATGDDGRVKSVFLEELAITNVTAWDDVPPSTAFGTTSPTYTGNVQVTATAAYGWWTERWVQADSGTFSADFANPGNGWRESEIGSFGEGDVNDTYYGGEVRAHIWDGDNDQVHALWHSADPRIIIVRGNDRIEAIDFPLGEPLTVELDDPNNPGVEFSETGIVTANPERPWETLLVFDLGEYTVPDEATVTASDETGTPLVTTEVIPFSIDDVDPDADTITGTAAAGSEVLVQADGNWRYPVADGSDTWVADFSQPGSRPGEENPVDLMPGSSGDATLLGEAGSATTVLWSLSNARTWVDPTDEHVWGNEFAPDGTVTISVGGADQGTFATQGDGSFDAYLDPATVDITGGTTVVVSDGETDKTHIVTDLAVAGADEAFDTVEGTAAAGSDVQAWVHETDAWRNLTAAGDGTWVADFSVPGATPEESGLADIVPGSNGATEQCDDDGDCTTIGWNLVNPVVHVDAGHEGLWGDGWMPDSVVTITIDGSEHSTLPTDADGNFGHTWDPMGLDLVAGMEVVVADDATTKTLEVSPLAITDIDTDTDVIGGVATEGGGIEIWVHDSDAWRHVDVDGTGVWSVDFGVPGPGEGEEGTADLIRGSNGNSSECDEDGDCTWASWDVVNPSFSVRLDEGEVHGYGWDLDVDVTMEIDDPGNGPGVDYTETQAPGPAPWDPEQTWVQFFPAVNGFGLMAGQVVTMTNGDVTKQHVVTPVAVTGIDVDADIVSGTADPDAYLRVDVYDGGFGHDVMSDGSGLWAADFSEGAEQGSFDLVPGTTGEVSEYDEDGDSTKQGWEVALSLEPVVYVSSTSGGNVDGLTFADEDILAFDTSTGTWELLFDGSDVGLRRNDINTFHLEEDGTILMVLKRPKRLGGFVADDSDVVVFSPTSLGSTTAGTFSLLLDGSDVGLSTKAEKIDALSRTPDGRLVISTTGSHKVFRVGWGWLWGHDEDLIVFDATSLGTTTSGGFRRYVDGSDIGLRAAAEDVWGASIDPGTGEIFLTTKGGYWLPEVAGDRDDVITFAPTCLGGYTSGTFAHFWDGDMHGFGDEAIDGLFVELASAP